MFAAFVSRQPREDEPRERRERIFQWWAVGATVVFAGVFFYARHLPFYAFDLPVTRWIQSPHTDWLDAAMEGFGHLGFPPWAPILVLSTMIVIFLLGMRWEAAMLLFAGIGIGVFNKLGKKFVEIPRPTADEVRVLSPITDFGFPSGHVMLFVAFGGFVLFLVYTMAAQSWTRSCGMILFGLLAGLAGISRIYVGHHWPSDVLGAYLLGSLLLAVTVLLYRTGRARFPSLQRKRNFLQAATRILASALPRI